MKKRSIRNIDKLMFLVLKKVLVNIVFYYFGYENVEICFMIWVEKILEKEINYFLIIKKMIKMSDLILIMLELELIIKLLYVIERIMSKMILFVLSEEGKI